PSAARSSSAASPASSAGTMTPVPPQPGHSPPIHGPPAAGTASPARPAGVSRTGRARSTTPRLRSPLPTAPTIGTGSSPSRPAPRAATGSWCAITRSTSLTPAGPSASPTAEATSATTTSTSIRRSLAPGHHGARAHPRPAAGSTVSSHIMPAKSPPGGGRPLLYPSRPRREADPAAPGKLLYTVDAALTPASPVTDIGELTALASDAVTAGRAHVLETSHLMCADG